MGLAMGFKKHFRTNVSEHAPPHPDNLIDFPFYTFSELTINHS
jgi:hypothetical protein